MRIIIGIDGSPQAAVGLRWVASLSLSSHDEVLIATVTDRPVLLGAWGYVDTDINREAAKRAWAAALAESRRLTEHACGEFRGRPCQVSVLVLDGHPVEALERAVREHTADLLVIGPHGRGRLESILLGSVSQSLLHVMPTSMLIAREPAGPPDRILLASDGSPASLAAAGFLARFLLAADATIEIVTALGGRSDGSADAGPADVRDFAAAERRHVEAANDRVMDALEAGGRTATLVIREGDPKRAILAAAAEHRSDLIVMGARGLGGFRGLALGSVSRAVSKAAPCSTLVVPAGPAAGQ
jgi:nucleotide-binding universal stress UspA family protein